MASAPLGEGLTARVHERQGDRHLTFKRKPPVETNSIHLPPAASWRDLWPGRAPSAGKGWRASISGLRASPGRLVLGSTVVRDAQNMLGSQAVARSGPARAVLGSLAPEGALGSHSPAYTSKLYFSDYSNNCMPQNGLFKS